ncbi:MAG: hypothetical protein GC185_03290 [Alphaproteobacteria bacterium]|nr:hypothetical protein [Alphaproteobacteria bacterium]
MLLDEAHGVLHRQLVFGLAQFILLAVFIIALLLSRRSAGTSVAARRRTLVLIVCLVVVTFFSGWYAAKPVTDIYELHRLGEKYIAHEDCKLERVLIPARGDKTLYCADGKILIESPRAWCYETGKSYKIDYLPASRLVVHADDAAKCGEGKKP